MILVLSQTFEVGKEYRQNPWFMPGIFFAVISISTNLLLAIEISN